MGCIGRAVVMLSTQLVSFTSNSNSSFLRIPMQSVQTQNAVVRSFPALADASGIVVVHAENGSPLTSAEQQKVNELAHALATSSGLTAAAKSLQMALLAPAAALRRSTALGDLPPLRIRHSCGIQTTGHGAAVQNSEAVANRNRKNMSFNDRVFEHLGRRIWPIGISVLFILLGSLYIFQWGSVVEHIPKLWLSPQDFWITYFNSSQLVHGHFGAIYQANVKFVEFPGMLVALAPLGALSGAFHTSTFEITKYGVVPAPGFVVHVRGLNVPFLNAQSIRGRKELVRLATAVDNGADLYALLLSCTALFACDALAERLRVPSNRRAVLCVAEAVLLWNVTVLWGHPEDAVAVALAVYALIFALDRRFVGAGWLFGAALAFQPLVLLMLPVLLAIAGRRYMFGMVIRSVLPTAVLIAAPLVSNFGATVHSLVDQPSPPGVNHVTPWTALSPNLGGGLVAAGPIRLLGLLVAIGLGFWVYRHWLERPELWPGHVPWP